MQIDMVLPEPLRELLQTKVTRDNPGGRTDASVEFGVTKFKMLKAQNTELRKR